MLDAIWIQISENPVTTLNTFLILGSIYLGYTGYIFQTRTSVRESLEQLDALEYKREKLQPILYEFTYTPLWKSKVVVQLKSYKKGDVAGVSSPTKTLHVALHRRGYGHKDTGNTLSREDYMESIQWELNQIEGINDVKVQERDILFTILSTDAVRVRRLTEEAIDSIHDYFHRHPRDIEAQTRITVGDDFPEDGAAYRRLMERD